ncbi:VOC family protein [Nocardioides cavernaquae]|uniref:VOC family protein n=1 Tax=Nocardioides cavernaquae TaxID=2321396 RepID=A0A3A5H704_9ACTN|nr:VOC family protein [Nocardioides cavernaquae]RJS45668.1 VOC family protein [Nocardioides cavernaquae]
MASRLNPYINFKDNAAEAMEFYQFVLGGELAVNKFGDMGDTGPAAELTMHAMLETPLGFTLMASDSHPDMGPFTAPAGFSVSLSGDDEEELTRYFNDLAADGTVGMPLGLQPWGDVFGHVIDKFGVSWMVNITGPGNAA